MSYVLDGLLSGPAADLYRRLLAAGRFALASLSEDAAALRELIDRGFARERYVGEPVVIPVEPARAVENAMLMAQRRILEQQRMLLRAREEMGLLQNTFLLGGADAEPEAGTSVQVLTDPAEIGALSVELCLSAEREFSNLETEHFRQAPDPRSAKLPPADVLTRGVRFRNIYARPVLEIPGADEMVRRCQDGGWELRVLPHLPTKMVLVDERAALLPLDPTGMTGAVLIRAPVILAMLRSYFEMLWTRAVALGRDETAPRLPAIQDRVLRLMLSGMTDAAIARHLRSSERTVRRHVASVQEALGVDNRMAAAVVAVREGWVR
jgi:DNA-binding CsgD family transcriptional regulator